MGRKAVFVDRDGTINRDVNYLDSPERLELYPTVAEGIRLLNNAGLLVVVITNQSGLARGFFSLETLAAIHEKLRGVLAASGASLDAIYVCPHHPNESCRCRKPGTGLLEKAVQEHNIDPGRSYLIGDRAVDIKAGTKMGCRTILVPEESPPARKEEVSPGANPDHQCRTFLEAVEWILGREGVRG